MRRIIDEFLIGLEVRLQQLLEFAKCLGHRLLRGFHCWPAAPPAGPVGISVREL